PPFWLAIAYTVPIFRRKLAPSAVGPDGVSRRDIPSIMPTARAQRPGGASRPPRAGGGSARASRRAWRTDAGIDAAPPNTEPRGSARPPPGRVRARLPSYRARHRGRAVHATRPAFRRGAVAELRTRGPPAAARAHALSPGPGARNPPATPRPAG